MESILTEHVEAYVYQEAKFGNQGIVVTRILSIRKKITSSVQLQMDLGNGPIARQSCQIIPKVLKDYHHESIDELLSRCNEHMVQKRGAAVAIVKVNYQQKTIQYSCVGNVRFYMLHDRRKDDLPSAGYGLSVRKTSKIKDPAI